MAIMTSSTKYRSSRMPHGPIVRIYKTPGGSANLASMMIRIYPGKQIGVLVAGNSGRPLGALGHVDPSGTKGLINPSEIKSYSTQEEDIASNWMATELRRHPVRSIHQKYEFLSDSRKYELVDTSLVDVVNKLTRLFNRESNYEGYDIGHDSYIALAIEDRNNPGTIHHVDQFNTRTQQSRPVRKCNLTQKEFCSDLFTRTLWDQGLPKWGMTIPNVWSVATRLNYNDRDHDYLMIPNYRAGGAACYMTNQLSKKPRLTNSYTYSVPDMYHWAESIDAHLSPKLTATEKSYNADFNHSFPCKLVFVAGPNAEPKSYVELVSAPHKFLRSAKKKEGRDYNETTARTYDNNSNRNSVHFYDCVAQAYSAGLHKMQENGVGVAVLCHVSGGIYAGPHKRWYTIEKARELIEHILAKNKILQSMEVVLCQYADPTPVYKLYDAEEVHTRNIGF